MTDTGFEDALEVLGKPDVRKLFVAYLVTYGGTALAPIAMAVGVGLGSILIPHSALGSRPSLAPSLANTIICAGEHRIQREQKHFAKNRAEEVPRE